MTGMTYPDAGNWRTASYTYGGGNCVEVASCPCDAGPGFRKSSASMANGDCVEAGTAPAGVLVRDTKDRGGVVLAYPVSAWRLFLADLNDGKVPSAIA